MSTKVQPFLWNDVPHDETLASELSLSLQVPLALGCVLAGRSVTTVGAAQAFLRPDLSRLTDPFLMPGMAAAVQRTLQAITDGERITIYGDYDSDGLTATTLLLEVLRSFHGTTVHSFIPQRVEDGFGFTLGALDKVIAAHQPSLIITADCGIRSQASVEEAKRAGVDVIIIDHHRPYDASFPNAVAILSPIMEGVPDTLLSLAAVGIAFTFCRALRAGAIAAGIKVEPDLDLWPYLDLVAMGTISGLQPLDGENRILVYHGLALLNDVAKRRPGVLAIMRAAGLRTEIGSYEVGFLIGPRLSAAGRVGNPKLALDLLLVEDAMEARRLAGQIDACNRERRRIEDAVLDAAIDSLGPSLSADACGLVAVGETWHLGTIGIVAARLCGRFHRPVVVISHDTKSLYRGSCRSMPNVDLKKILGQCSAYLEDYGGCSPTAAGFKILKKNITAFGSAFEAACHDSLRVEALTEHVAIDAWISLADADDVLLESIKQLQPLGLGNQTPIWGVRNVCLQGPPKIVGGNHLKVTVVGGGVQRDAIGYGLGDRKLPPEPLDVLFQLQRNHFKGRSALQLSIKDFRPSCSKG